ncbi:MAG: hydrogenase iron-sulfur subunit [Betaproteobacteria bacterium]|nr:hydrogenase iron-sulfur subunit [Betaproteobacteria bacterium]
MNAAMALRAVERSFDRAFGARVNPWRNLGALSFWLFWILAATGIVLYVFFDTGVEGAYASVERLTRDHPFSGGLLHSMHRYAADAFLAVVLLHLLKELVDGHFRRYRWFSWVSGLPLLWLMYASGMVGFWLAWDQLAQFSATATAEWFDVLGLTAEPIVRNFLAPGAVGDRLFTLFVFMHVGGPLFLLGGMWIHVKRIGQPRTAPPRALALGTLSMLGAMSLVWPVFSHGPANLARVPGELALDWLYLSGHPLMYATSPAVLWLVAVGLTAALGLLPAVLALLTPARGAAPQIVQVSAANCNGCGRCVADCPFAAVMLKQHPDRRGMRLAEVVPELCAGCGICVGACPSSTPFRSTGKLVTGIDLPHRSVDAVRAELERKFEGMQGESPAVVFACECAADAASIAGTATAVISLPCAGMLPPAFVEYALRHGAQEVMVNACREGECAYRLGDAWTSERLGGMREPYLRASVARELVALGGCARGEEAALASGLAALRARNVPPRATRTGKGGA